MIILGAIACFNTITTKCDRASVRIIAETGKIHSMTLVTRNIKNFDSLWSGLTQLAQSGGR
jgi:hypothetical protein